jgi:ribosomal protein S12 methylthiotransferase
MKAYLTTLGCPKNVVDSEVSITLLLGAGCAMANDPEDADVLVVNACSFLESSWRETVDEVRRLSRYKDRDRSKRLILMGCLPKHRQEDLKGTLPWVDHFVPSGGHAVLPQLVGAGAARPEAPDSAISVAHEDRFAGLESRVLLTPPHTAYVKIAEGCSRRCTFCAIPQIRGGMVSRSVDSIVREVGGHVDNGVKEISLLAQDITSYHWNGVRFPDLVDVIVDTGIEWIRVFYVHPGSLTPSLVRRLFRHPSVCRYLEAPIQHASDRMLKRMGRPYTRDHMERLFDAVKGEFPEVMIRSEVIVGFPGEREEDFDALKDLVLSSEFASLGIFTYSAEPNTAAVELDGTVPESAAVERAAELRDIQESVSFAIRSDERGKRHRILVDRKVDAESAVYEDCAFAGRYYGQAFEVDGEVYLAGKDLPVGDFVTARITDSEVFDLKAEVL